uniref:Rac GTPase activating protein 1 n=1 Tax=Neogobius melanostomus TaxID=47308 RepID=A0A8C6SSF8_9GOBI
HMMIRENIWTFSFLEISFKNGFSPIEFFEESRRKWLRADEELVSCRELLTKAQTESGALEVKLKHARNQVDVEIRRRQKAEATHDKLERQLQLIRELLLSDPNSSSAPFSLSEEQRSALAFLSAHSQVAQSTQGNPNSSRRLNTIDESASLLSDISFDQTDDSLICDTSAMKTVRLQKRQKRRSSRKLADAPPKAAKRSRSAGRPDAVNESIVAKTTITVPMNGGAMEAVSTIETVPYWTRSRKRSGETRFGKVVLRCQNCRMVSHPECRERCPLPCEPTTCSTPLRTNQVTLADFAPLTSPMIPALVIYCIKEIERRGLQEVGLYRVSGQDHQVKELKEKLIRGKTLPSLGKVEDIHVVTGVLKDFLRHLPEPLLTCALNRSFMNAAELQDEDNSCAALYHVVSELPQPNRDTLACLVLHLQKVSQCVETKMDATNLSRVFGPTLVGHAVPDPDPTTILQDTNRQPRVVERLLSIPAAFWTQFAHPDNEEREQLASTPDHRGTKTLIPSPLSSLFCVSSNRVCKPCWKWSQQ